MCGTVSVSLRYLQSSETMALTVGGLKNMIALQLKINGNIVFTAGEDDWDSLHAILSLRNEVRGQASSFDLNVGGSCKAGDPCRGDSIRWQTQYLSINDEISIKLIETNVVDKPIARLKRKDLEERYDPKYTDKEHEEMDLELYRKLKYKYEKDT